MKGLAQWLLRNLALPLGMVAVSAGAAAIYQSGEIDAHQYRLLRNSFKSGSPAYQTAVAEAMSNGTVNRWERTGLLQQYWNENNELAVDFGATNVAEERLVLAAMTRQVRPAKRLE